MSTVIGIGFSQNPYIQHAAFEAGHMARRQLNETDADLILLLATNEYCQPEVLPAIRSVITSKQLIGTSTCGIILSHQILHRGIALLAIKSSDIHFSTSSTRFNANTNFRTAGFELAHALTKDLNTHRQGCLLLGDVFYHNSQDFLTGFAEVFGLNSPLVAGVSSHSSLARRNYQFHNNQILEHHAVGLLLSGNNRICVESRHGFKLLGQPRIATKTHEHVIRTIDDKPAIQLYEDFLNKPIDQLIKDPLKPHQLYPLGVLDEKANRYLVRNPVDILADGSIVFHGDVAQGSEVHLMISSKRDCIQSACDAAQMLKESLADKHAECILMIESSTRQRLLGRTAQSEILNIREMLGFATPLFGFYSNGEIAPWAIAGEVKHNYLNNGGLILTGIT